MVCCVDAWKVIYYVCENVGVDVPTCNDIHTCIPELFQASKWYTKALLIVRNVTDVYLEHTVCAVPV